MPKPAAKSPQVPRDSKGGGRRTPQATERRLTARPPAPALELVAGRAAATWEPAASLSPWEKNPRRNAAAVPRVLGSLVRFGWGRALVAKLPERRVVVGHTALAAAKGLAAAWEQADEKARRRWHPEAVETARTGLVPVRLREMTDAEADAYTVADNRLGEFALWDDAPLLEILRDFRPEDQIVIGYEADDIARLVASVAFANAPAPTPPAPAGPPITKPGDLWILGPHRLLCGDARKPMDVARVLDGNKPALMVTDPPWGVEYDPNWRGAARKKAVPRDRKIANDDLVSWRGAWELSPADVVYIWQADKGVPDCGNDLRALGFELRALIVWVKGHFPIGRGHYHNRHEPCWYAVRKGKESRWIGDRKQSTVWEVPLDATVDGGPSSQKPIELMAKGIRNHTGDVYEPFAGAGGVLIAAGLLERRCFALDIDPLCVDAVVRRWELATGGKAKRA
jgi:DNA modification methylase